MEVRLTKDILKKKLLPWSRKHTGSVQPKRCFILNPPQVLIPKAGPLFHNKQFFLSEQQGKVSQLNNKQCHSEKLQTSYQKLASKENSPGIFSLNKKKASAIFLKIKANNILIGKTELPLLEKCHKSFQEECVDQTWLSKPDFGNLTEQKHPGPGQVALNFSRDNTEKPARRSCFVDNRM